MKIVLIRGHSDCLLLKTVLAKELCFKILDVDLSSAIQRSETGCG